MNWAFWRSDKGEGSRAHVQPRPDKAAREPDSERLDEAVALRAQARRRLIGAAVLLLVTAAVVPLVLDPLPRAVPDSITIELRSDKAPDKPASPPRAPVPLPDPASLQGAPPPDAASESDASPPGAPGAKPAASGAEGKAAEARSTGDAAADTGRVDGRVDSSAADPKAAAAGGATVKAVTDAAKPRPDAKPESRADAKTEAPPDPKAAPKSDTARPAKSAARSDARFAVQAAAPRSEQAARELMAKLKSAGLPAFIERTEAADGPRWRVRAGPYPTRADAERARARLRELGHGADLVAL